MFPDTFHTLFANPIVKKENIVNIIYNTLPYFLKSVQDAHSLAPITYDSLFWDQIYET